MMSPVYCGPSVREQYPRLYPANKRSPPPSQLNIPVRRVIQWYGDSGDTRGHVGREVLIKLDPADWQMEERRGKLYFKLSSSCTTTEN